MKKHLKKYVFISFILSFTLHSCYHAENEKIIASSNYITKEIKNIAPFNKIILMGSPDVEYRQNKENKSTIRIYGSDNLIDKVETTIHNGTLEIKLQPGTSYNGEGRLKVILSSPQLDQASIIGSGDIDLIDILQGKDLKLEINGSGDIDAKKLKYESVNLFISGSGDIDLRNVNSNKIVAEIHGSGDIKLKGKTNEGSYSIAGSGDIQATQLTAQSVHTSVMGSGDISCNAQQKLEGNISGSGNISYSGNPKQLQLNGKNKNYHKIQ